MSNTTKNDLCVRRYQIFACVICMFNTPLSYVFTKMPFLTVIMYHIVLISLFCDGETISILTKWYNFFSSQTVKLLNSLIQTSDFGWFWKEIQLLSTCIKYYCNKIYFTGTLLMLKQSHIKREKKSQFPDSFKLSLFFSF